VKKLGTFYIKLAKIHDLNKIQRKRVFGYTIDNLKQKLCNAQ